MNLRSIVKTAVNVATMLGTYKIVNDAIETVTPEDQSTTDTVMYKFGAAGIGGIVADASSEYTSSIVDKLFDAVDELKNPSPKE